MVKIYRSILTTLLLASVVVMSVGTVEGAQVAGQSAQLNWISQAEYTPVSEDLRVQKIKIIKKVLEKYNSPMADSAEAFVDTCFKYQLNCYLLPSIAGLESTFGKFLMPDSYNPFGWGGGYIYFDDWADGIDTVGKGLRKNYLDKGAVGIEQVGKIYSESPTWAPRVQYFIREFERAEAEENQLQLALDTVQ